MHHEPHRVHFRHRPAAYEDHPRSRIAGRGAGDGDGVQAHRGRSGPLAGGERPHLIALVRAGALFVNGKLVEGPDDHHQPEAA